MTDSFEGPESRGGSAALPERSGGAAEPREAGETANVVTHGIGIVASIAAAAILIVMAAVRGDPWQIVGVSVFATTCSAGTPAACR